jgi:hypothetical protein
MDEYSSAVVEFVIVWRKKNLWKKNLFYPFDKAALVMLSARPKFLAERPLRNGLPDQFQW